jgi:hypothetical protein
MVGVVSSFGQALQIAFQLVRVRRGIARLRRSNPDEIIETLRPSTAGLNRPGFLGGLIA